MTMREYELYHTGRKGMKWGQHIFGKVRTGAKRAASATGKFAGKQAANAKKEVVKKVKQSVQEHKEKNYYKKLHKKKLSQMTDKEIDDLTKRVKKEANLKDAKYESRVQNARKFYNNVAKQPVNSFANTFGVEVAKKIVGNNNNGNNKKPSKPDKPGKTGKESEVAFDVNITG